MITPRRTTLTSVPDLRTLQRSIAESCVEFDVAAIRATAVLVPTRSAASQLRRTLERLWLLEAPTEGRPRAIVLPELLTRSEWYRVLLQRSGARGPLLTDIEREVLLGAAAREAMAAGAVPPFRMRPGLVAEMLSFYDTLQRQGRSLSDFDRLVTEDLEPRAEFDRGAERLLRQTRFLVSAFSGLEAKVEAAGALDEQRLRRSLIEGGRSTLRRVIVTVGDRASDPAAGLFPVDFDLLSRLPYLESIEIVATRAMLLSGLGERLRELLPGIEERDAAGKAAPPTLLRPAGEGTVPYFPARDREEELRDVARRIKRHLSADGRVNRQPSSVDGQRPTVDDRRSTEIAVIFRRPLPYVYLGRSVLDAAGIEYQAADALPLAAEPFAAALDLVFSAVASRFARAPLMQLLRSPQFSFADAGATPVPPRANETPRSPLTEEAPAPPREAEAAEWAALDRALAEAGYLGDVARLAAFAPHAAPGVAHAASVAVAVATELAPLSTAAPMSSHLEVLLSFLQRRECLRPDHAAASERHLRARAAVLRILNDLRAAASRFDDPSATIEVVAPTIRRWLESQTFTPIHGSAGVQLADASSARYGDFDEVHLVGLVAGDWPQPSARSIFYPPFLLARLGWPPESARLAAERAAFEDLLLLAHRRVAVSCFTLEDDSIVEASPLLESLDRMKLGVELEPAAGAYRIFTDEALVEDRPDPALSPSAAAWMDLRRSRSAATEPQFHGFIGSLEAFAATVSRAGDTPPAPGRPWNVVGPASVPAAGASRSRAYTITGIDRYLECPFKYFARTVLGLPEDSPDEPGLSPKERGRFVHEVFRAFFTEWQSAGGGAVGVDRLDAARTLFAAIVEEKLATLPPADAPLERMRLLGTVAAPGLGEIVLAAEAVRPAPVAERLLEYPFEGEFTLVAGGAERQVRLRGKADRVDLLGDGRFRVVDYKTGRAPDNSIQLPMYAVCLRQHLVRQGRPAEIGEAFYVAFGERTQPVEIVLDEGSKSASALEQAQERALAAIDGIERGEFPPRPAMPRLCGFCAFATVCRKDVVVAD